MYINSVAHAFDSSGAHSRRISDLPAYCGNFFQGLSCGVFGSPGVITFAIGASRPGEKGFLLGRWILLL